MIPRYLLTLLIIGLFSPITVHAQSKNLENISSALEAYTKNHPQEKVYLHTDRSYYATGESIWFQTYLTAGPLNLPSPLSYPVYVQLIDDQEQLIDQKVVLTPNGFGSGVLDLADTLLAGEYTLVAFTNWMRNTGEEFFFRKDISVLTNTSIEESTKLLPNEIDIQFFPEGGYLVEGIPTRVAFKAIDENGRSVNIDGSVLDESGQEINSLNVIHSGMGFFYITPEAGKTYKAFILGTDKSFNLPEVQKTGVGMRLNSMPNDLLKLTLTANNISQNQKNLSVLVHSKGLVTFSASIDLSGTIALLNIPTSDLPSGISHLTVFDQNNNPILERLFFVDNTPDPISIASDKQAYKRREKVSVTIKLDDVVSDTLNGIFSMSAYDLGQTIDKEPESNIYTELLLNSDLRGNLENPAYYFNKENPDANAHLDLVMLTHGWRRFTWDKVLDKKDEALTFDFERGLTLKGTTYRAFSDNPQSSKLSLVNLAETIPSVLEIESSKSGEFEFRDLFVFEGEELMLKSRREKGKKKKLKDDIKIVIDSSYYQATPFSNIAVGTKDRLGDAEKQFLEQRKLREKIDAAYDFDSTATRLDDVIVEAERVDATGQELESTVFGRGTNAIDFTKGPPISAPTILQALVGKIPGVVVSGQNITIRQNGTAGGTPLILIDDVPTDVEFVNGFSPDQFYKVVVFKGVAASARFGNEGFNGALAFYTKTGAGIIDERFEKEDGLIATKLKNSYQQPREFYAPKYEIQQPEHVKPDYRILLHWQPMIYLGDEKEATVEFWASDLETTVLVNVQGLLQDGTPVSKVIYFEIEK